MRLGPFYVMRDTSVPNKLPPSAGAEIVRRRLAMHDASLERIKLHGRIRRLEAALAALVAWAEGKQGDDFGDTEWERARKALRP